MQRLTKDGVARFTKPNLHAALKEAVFTIPNLHAPRRRDKVYDTDSSQPSNLLPRAPVNDTTAHIPNNLPVRAPVNGGDHAVYDTQSSHANIGKHESDKITPLNFS